MNNSDKFCICLISVVVAVMLSWAVPNMLSTQEKIEEIPQYGCYILNIEMQKWNDNPVIYDALQKEWFKKQCWESQKLREVAEN